MAAPDKQLIEKLRAAFARIAGADGLIDAAELQQALGLQSDFLAGRVFRLLDENGDGRIAQDEFLRRVHALLFGDEATKLRFVFTLHDLDDDGRISRAEVRRIIELSIGEEGLELSEARVDALVEALFRNADGDTLSAEAFSTAVMGHSEVLDQITRTASVWIAPNEDLLGRLHGPRVPFLRRAVSYLQNHGLVHFSVFIWIVANIGLFAQAVWRYHQLGAHWSILLARGCGACLNFNGALILIPMMRRLLTRLRKSKLHHLLPIDESIAFHRLCGHAMFAFGVVHTAAHFTNYALNTPSFRDSLFGTKAGLTGFILLLVFFTMWVFSLNRVRRSGRFELFYFSHMLYAVWFVLCLMHGPVFWIWAGVPILGYLIERVLRLAVRAKSTKILQGQVLRSGVTHLQIQKPQGWQHAAGDYLFLRIPKLSRFEWHPFTISSAPEHEPFVGVHVRSLGNWTSALRKLYTRRAKASETEPLRAFIDGPYGTSSAHIFECRNAVLLGAGIGVTPFASILQSILYRKQGKGAPLDTLQKVHFIWLNRDQYSFEWFADLLADIERQDEERLIDMHIYMTDGRVDITHAALNVARELVRHTGGKDLVTQLRTPTRFGPPDFDQLLRSIVQQHAPEQVNLFFCGPPGLAKVVRKACGKLGIVFRQEHF